jgi:hypothetical protein
MLRIAMSGPTIGGGGASRDTVFGCEEKKGMAVRMWKSADAIAVRD